MVRFAALLARLAIRWTGFFLITVLTAAVRASTNRAGISTVATALQGRSSSARRRRWRPAQGVDLDIASYRIRSRRDVASLALQVSIASDDVTFFCCSRRRRVGSSLMPIMIRSRINESSSCSKAQDFARFRRSAAKSSIVSSGCWTRW